MGTRNTSWLSHKKIAWNDWSCIKNCGRHVKIIWNWLFCHRSDQKPLLQPFITQEMELEQFFLTANLVFWKIGICTFFFQFWSLFLPVNWKLNLVYLKKLLKWSIMAYTVFRVSIQPRDNGICLASMWDYLWHALHFDLVANHVYLPNYLAKSVGILHVNPSHDTKHNYAKTGFPE